MTSISSANVLNKNRFTQFCLKGLEKMYILSEHVFPASHQLSGGQMVDVRDRVREYRFTMNALMGLYHAQRQGNRVFLDIESDYHGMASRIEEQGGSTVDIAATAWTGRCIGTVIPPKATSLFQDLLENAPQIKHLSAKALAWSIAACMTGGEEYHQNALSLAKLAAERFVHKETALVREVTVGVRKNWASFGSHSYMSYAFLLLAHRTGNTWARDIGLRIAHKLVQLQGRDGQWGWMYHVPSGRVADLYPVFSVHQYAYAPFFLVEAIDQGYEEFREPLVRGFRWILGHNEIGQSMVEPMHQIVWRRVIRKGANSKLIKLFRAMLTIHGGLKSSTKGADALEIDHQCWGFEMALPLCVFSGRSDFSEILDDVCFPQ
jgi:hypothetical protein